MLQSERLHGVRRTLVMTLCANLLVAVAKVVVGLFTGSLAMIGDGVHSSVDASSNVVGLISTALSARPPDSDHPYGHRRIETLATLVIGVALTLTAWEIGKTSIVGLTSGIAPEVTTANFVTMIVTIVVNLGISAYEKRMGSRFGSEFLKADAAHTRSDVYVSLTVLASLVAVRLGWGWMDAIAALVVVILIARAAWGVLRPAVDILVDHAALEPEHIRRIVEQVPGIENVRRVRSRGPGDEVYLDIDVEVAAPTTAEHSANIAREIRRQLRRSYQGLKDIQVFFIPQHDTPADYTRIARAEADALGLGVHEIIPSTNYDGLVLDMHVEVPPELSVGQAHERVTEFEKRLRSTIPGLKRVVTHIEPFHVHETAPLYSPDVHDLARGVLRIAKELYPHGGWHDLAIRPEADGGYAISMHCHVDPDIPLGEAHRLVEEVETSIKAIFASIHRMTIHTEPLDHD